MRLLQEIAPVLVHHCLKSMILLTLNHKRRKYLWRNIDLFDLDV